MADMTPLTDILNGNPANAVEVQTNFQTVEAYINGSEIVKTDGSNAMAADLDLGAFQVSSMADGTADDDAMAFGQRSRLVYSGTATQATTATTAPGVGISIGVETYDIGTVGSVGSSILTMPAAGLYVFTISTQYSSGSGVVKIYDSYTNSEHTTASVSSSDSTGVATVVAYMGPAALTFAWLCLHEVASSATTFDSSIRAYRLALG